MNKQISLQASEISLGLLKVMGKGAAGTTVCCALLSGISHSAVSPPTTQGTQTPQVPISVSQNSTFAGLCGDIWTLEGKH